MTSIKDVAREAGVSTATVSRVLANKPHVRPVLRERVLAAVAKLDYRPNLVARSLRQQHSSTIGLIVSDIRNPYFTAVSRAVEDVAYREGMSVFLCNADEDPAKEAMYLAVMRGERVSGVIYSPTRQTARDFDRLALDFPVVVIDREVESGAVDMVLIDNTESAYRLASHLIENGYRQLAGLFGEASTTGAQRRLGFLQALDEQGLTAAHDNFVPPRVSAGHERVGEWLDGERAPDAIFTSNGLLTAGALQAIRERGLVVPTDVALVGFDDTPWTQLVQPAITVIAQPTDEIGRSATELLLQRIATPDRAPRRVILNGTLIARGSSAPRG